MEDPSFRKAYQASYTYLDKESIQDLVRSYLDGQITADELNDRLPDCWKLDEADDPDATKLTMQVIGYLAGFQSGDRDEENLRARLKELV